MQLQKLPVSGRLKPYCCAIFALAASCLNQELHCCCADLWDLPHVCQQHCVQQLLLRQL
jgi:hypothetical protein